MSHHWKFFRAGGFDQVRLSTGADLLALDQLDQKLWVALACPTRGLEFDSKTLDLIDTDKDGRIRPPELIAAVKWAGAMLKNADDLIKGGGTVALSSFNDGTPEGKQLLASARQILVNLGKSDAQSITLEDTADSAKIFASTVLNGDGVIIAESAKDDATRAVIADIAATWGTTADRSGKPGINQAAVDKFFAEAAGFSDWNAKAESDAATILPLGAGTAAAVAALLAVKGKVDDYFGRCRLAAFDPRALAALNREEKEYLALAAKDLSITAQEVAGFPLAQIAAGKPLPLGEGVNPAWATALGTFVAAAVKPLLGEKTSLTEADWSALCSKLAGYQTWAASKAGTSVEKLGLDRIRTILAGKYKETLTALIADDKKLEAEANSIANVDRLLRYQRDLFKLTKNFVNFADFYGRREKAIFQAGSLFLDTRTCDLVLTVEDGGRHASMAGLAGTYLAYIDCTRKGTGEKGSFVAAFTGGDSDDLMVGRNGVFYDRKGRDWDATITKIIDNPISIRQAFASPYKKLIRLIEEQVVKRAAAADAAANERLQAAATAAANADKTKPVEAAKPEPKKIDLSVIAAMGVAFGGITAALGAILQTFFGLGIWMPLGLVGIVLLISGPSMILAWLKLRRRNLGPILDANGWAVNAKARMNVPFGGSLTATAALPPGSERDLVDPFADKPNPWPTRIVLLVILLLGYLWMLGRLDGGLPAPVKYQNVFGTNSAPAKVVEPKPADAK